MEKYVATAVQGDTQKRCLLSIAPPRQTAVSGSRTDGRLLATERQGAGGRTLRLNGMSGGGERRRRGMPPGHASWTMRRTPPASPIREAATCDHHKRGGEGGGWGRRMPTSHPSQAVQTAPAWASPGKKWACRQWACTLANGRIKRQPTPCPLYRPPRNRCRLGLACLDRARAPGMAAAGRRAPTPLSDSRCRPTTATNKVAVPVGSPRTSAAPEWA